MKVIPVIKINVLPHCDFKTFPDILHLCKCFRTINIRNAPLFKFQSECAESASLFPTDHSTTSLLATEACGILYNIGSSTIFVSSFFGTFFTIVDFNCLRIACFLTMLKYTIIRYREKKMVLKGNRTCSYFTCFIPRPT